MTPAEIVTAFLAVGAEVFLSASGAVQVRNPDAVPAELRDQARVHREAIAAALEAAEHEAQLRADPRARWRALGDDHPAKFGWAVAGALLPAVHAWENAWTDDEAADALAAFNDLADRALAQERTDLE